MVFSSLLFLYGFLPLVLLLYYLSKNINIRNGILIIASLLFYAWGEPIWVLLLFVSAFSAYIFAVLIDRGRTISVKKLYLALAITLNLAILGFFKYAHFVLEQVDFLIGIHIPLTEFALPIGISFYTFQTISYIVDVYRKKYKTERSFSCVLLYVSMFPQLIAGPIVRFTQVKNQLKKRSFSLRTFAYGVQRFVIGLAKKVILANTVGDTATYFLDGNPGDVSVLGAWFGITLFALQIYFDFSGYSDMAIGLGKMFGFHYPENFKYPYTSRSVGEFWRRWNITLGRFFRDYVYIPLGGNRRLYARNLFVVWFLTGFWHGAGWNFIVWGLYFGTFIFLERSFLMRWLNRAPRIIGHLYLVIVVWFGWVFFYFPTLKSAFHFAKSMLGLNGNPVYSTSLIIHVQNEFFLVLVAILSTTPLFRNGWRRLWIFWREKSKRSTHLKRTVQPIWGLLMLVLSTALLISQSFNPFLYFRF